MTIRTRTEAEAKPATVNNKIPYDFRPDPKFIRDLIRRHDLRRVDGDVLQVLLDFRIIHRDSCWCSKKKIASELGISERTVQYALERLEKARVICRAQVSGPHQEDPDEPRNRTGWRIYFLFITDRTTFGPGPDRRPPLERKRRESASLHIPREEAIFASSPDLERKQLSASSEEATFCFESKMDPKPELKTTTSEPSLGSKQDFEVHALSSSSLAPLSGNPETPPPIKGPEFAEADVDQALLAATVALMVTLSAGFKVSPNWTPETARDAILGFARHFGCPVWWVHNATAKALNRKSSIRGTNAVESEGYVAQVLANWSMGNGSPGQSPAIARPKPPAAPPPRPAPAPERGENPAAPPPEELEHGESTMGPSLKDWLRQRPDYDERIRRYNQRHDQRQWEVGGG